MASKYLFGNEKITEELYFKLLECSDLADEIEAEHLHVLLKLLLLSYSDN